jgi:3-oxoacid CoA-transferase subunit A
MKPIFNNIYATADLHGWEAQVTQFCEKIPTTQENDVMILLGDASLNYYCDKRDDGVKKRLAALPLTYFLIRGNHEQRPSILEAENPDKWHTEIFWGNIVYVENDYPNIKYAKDDAAVYHIPMTIQGNIQYIKTLVLPGAYSVDKEYRIERGWNWFDQEQLSEEEQMRARTLIEKENWDFDMVLSHTCPKCYTPVDLFLSFIDQSTVDYSMERFLGDIEFTIMYKLWLWGHFHQYRKYLTINNRLSQPLMLSDTSVLHVSEWFDQYAANGNTSFAIPVLTLSKELR